MKFRLVRGIGFAGILSFIMVTGLGAAGLAALLLLPLFYIGKPWYHTMRKEES